MLELRVQIIVNKKIKGFKPYEKGQWSKTKDYSGKDIYDIISQVNNEYGIKSYYNEEISNDYTYYESDIDDVSFIIDMG